MTTPSVTANELEHRQTMGQMIAAIDNKFNTIQKTCVQQPIGQQRPKTSERNIRSDLKKSEHRPLRPSSGLSRSRKSTTTIHHDQGPALPKPGLEQGVIKPFRFKDDRKLKQGSRLLKAKSVTPSNTVTGPIYPNASSYEKAEDQITPSNISHQKHKVLIVPSPCCPSSSGGVQPHLPHMLLGSIIPGPNIPQFSQSVLASAPQAQCHYPLDTGLQRGPPPSLSEDKALYFEPYSFPLQDEFEHFRITSQPQFSHSVMSTSQPPVIKQRLQTTPCYKGQSQPLENNAGYAQLLNGGPTFTGFLGNWDERTVVDESLNLMDPQFESSPKLAEDYDWASIGGFANNTQDSWVARGTA
jgi:hypothetical protein